jgi:hypothetical protein
LCIAGVSNGRNNWAPILAVVYIFPFNTIKERVVFDAPCAAFDVTEAFMTIHGTEGDDQVFGSI